MAYRINYAYTCHTGKVRGNNEDNFWCCGKSLPVENQGIQGTETGSARQKDFPVLAVFDGMGGESCGEMAAFLAADTFGKCYEESRGVLKKAEEDFMGQACVSMNHEICRYGAENRIRSIGTTMAAAVFGTKQIHIWNLGDSRIYELRGGKLRQISTDHVSGNSMFGKAPLTQYLGVEEESMALEPSAVAVDYENGNRYLLCSDGVTDMLSDGEIADVLMREASVKETVEVLLERALKNGGRDNVTIVLCEIEEYGESRFASWMARLGRGKN